MARRRRLKGEVDAVHPNAGLQAQYRKRLDRLIDEMNRSVLHWISAAFKANEPRTTEQYAEDASPTSKLSQAMQQLMNRWTRRFSDEAPDLSEWFAKRNRRYTDEALRERLRAAGFTVEFRMTPAQRDVFQSTVEANVALIKSIPQQYLTQVEGMVMRSVQAGRDLKQLTDAIQGEFGVTRRRAAFIARDQNNKATSALQKARQLELGVVKGVWIHSGGGREPRPKHVAASGKTFDIRKGMKVGDKGQWVMPGEEINCRCVWRAVVPGFD